MFDEKEIGQRGSGKKEGGFNLVDPDASTTGK
jgi:hypothetical protein